MIHGDSSISTTEGVGKKTAATIQYEDDILPIYEIPLTILRPSYLHNEISYAGKMISVYWIGAQVGTGTMQAVSVHTAVYWKCHWERSQKFVLEW